MRALVDLLGDPQKAYRAIHLTGTNGKTSTARMIDELLRGFGIRTGRYTSPHLTSVTERIVIDGAPISDRTFVEGYREIEPYVEMVDERFDVPLSFFEIVTGLAFAIFADAPIDVAVVEVGLGGTWDNTNVIDGEVAVVTPIGLDHTQYLGDTVVSIATEKAGIIKPDAVAILALQPADAAEELLRRAVEVDATIAREGMEFGVIERRIAVGGQFLDPAGPGRASTTRSSCRCTARTRRRTRSWRSPRSRRSSAPARPPCHRRRDRAGRLRRGRVPGRLEVVRSAPTDPARRRPQPVRADRHADRGRRGLPVPPPGRGRRPSWPTRTSPGCSTCSSRPSTSSSSPRSAAAAALDVDELAALAVPIFGADRVTVEPRLDDAIDAAVRLAEQTDDPVLSGAGVLVTGSVVTVGEARTLLRRRS